MYKNLLAGAVLATILMSGVYAAVPTQNVVPTQNLTPTANPVQSNQTWSRKGKVFVGGSFKYNMANFKPSQIFTNTTYDDGTQAFSDVSSFTGFAGEVRYGITERLMLGASYESLSYDKSTSGTSAGTPLTISQGLTSGHFGLHAYFYLLSSKSLSAYVGGAYRFYNPTFHYGINVSGVGTYDASLTLPVSSPYEVFVGAEKEIGSNVFLTGQAGYRFTSFNGQGSLKSCSATGAISCTAPNGTAINISGFDMSGAYFSGGVGTYF